MRTTVLLLFLFLAAACTSPDPLGFVARAERDTEIARIRADNEEVRLIFAAGFLIAGLILALVIIRSNERVYIARAQAQAAAEAQRRLPPPILGRYTLLPPADDDHFPDDRQEAPQRQIARRSTALARPGRTLSTHRR